MEGDDRTDAQTNRWIDRWIDGWTGVIFGGMLVLMVGYSPSKDSCQALYMLKASMAMWDGGIERCIEVWIEEGGMDGR